MFVLRTLLDDDVPTNDGIARAIEIVLPERGSAVNAAWPAAVAAGNVEMSQRITDTHFRRRSRAPALDVPAQGQGTMNNVTFGGDGWTFYETLGGGQGAIVARTRPERGARGDEQHAQHADRVARVGVLRFGSRSTRFARGIGGAGTHAGGDGVVRRYRALEPCTVTLLTERRRRAPAGRRAARAARWGAIC